MGKGMQKSPKGVTRMGPILLPREIENLPGGLGTHCNIGKCYMGQEHGEDRLRRDFDKSPLLHPGGRDSLDSRITDTCSSADTIDSNKEGMVPGSKQRGQDKD